MILGKALLIRLGSVYLALLLIFLMMDVNARPANMSAHKDKSPNSKEENEILPPDHLNGLKMEMDGHLNKDFHQEVFLGKDLEEFEEDSEPRKNRKKLKDIFSKVDINKDKSVSAKEMQRWIMEKTEEHFQEAVKENKLNFRAVDPDGDGHVAWDEYRIKFLASKGFNEKEVVEKIKNNEELKIDEERQRSSFRCENLLTKQMDPNAESIANAIFFKQLHCTGSDALTCFGLIMNENIGNLESFPENSDSITCMYTAISLTLMVHHVARSFKCRQERKLEEQISLGGGPSTQEVLENLKDRWFQADNPPADQLLNEEEFLSFLHPEHSRGMLKFMVKEIVRDLGCVEGVGLVKRLGAAGCVEGVGFDQDGDKKLTLSEFISLPVGTVENQQAQDIDDDWVRERRKEFQEVIDANHDGIVTEEELEEYMDPMNEYNALNEAKQMIAVADENQNHSLELVEILKYSEYFTGSKLMDYARNVHEEF
ncbi:CAB45 protein, partial [Polyodon spathula]|nr:CAB45 protein [Polyodon spathula]